MKHIKAFNESEFRREEFPTTEFTVGRFDIPSTKEASFLDALYQKVFYEGHDKRHSMWSLDTVRSLSDKTKSYLLQLKDMVEAKGLLEGPLGLFRSVYGRDPENEDEEVRMISGNLWGGYGRKGGIQGKMLELPVPDNDVMQDLMKTTMSPNQKQQVIETYIKMFRG